MDLKPRQNKKGQNVCWDAPKKNAAFYVVVEKKHLVRCLLKTKRLMKRQLVKGSNLLKKHPDKCFGPSCFSGLWENRT